MNKIVLSLITCLILTTAYTQNSVEISRDWTSFTQVMDIVSETEKKFKVVASVKVDTGDEAAWAGVWARVDNKSDETGFFDNMGNRPIKVNEWKSYTVQGVINKDSKRLNFGGLCLNNGKFYFDKFELFIENNEGVMEPVAINNAGFENTVSSGLIPNWNQGVSKGKQIKIKEFEITSTSDTADGEKALLIEGSGVEPDRSGIIEPLEGYSPQIGTMISMLNNLSSRVERIVGGMSQYEIDHLHDEKANRIGALIMHLAAAEAYYQVFTFEERGFNEEEKKKWDIPLDLGPKARELYKGHEIQYYLDIYKEVRKKTIEEFKKRNDAWFSKIPPGAGINNHFSWFHVMEHQSSHLGQILFLRKRIPPESEVKLPVQMKN